MDIETGTAIFIEDDSNVNQTHIENEIFAALFPIGLSYLLNFSTFITLLSAKTRNNRIPV